MKIKEVTKKALCLSISALMLTASLPMQVFAQDTPTDKWLELVQDPREEFIAHKYAQENHKYFLESGLTIFEDKTTGEIRFGGKTGVAPEKVVWSQEQLREVLSKPELAEKLFGPVDRYAKFARVQAVQAKGGEEIVTILADGTRETQNVAKAGEWIVTNPGGEKYIVPEAKFAKKYEKALDLGDGWFKPKGAPQDFREIKQDITMMASWGEEQFLRKGAHINVTDINDLYGVAEDEFRGTYKTVKQLYKENFNAIERFLSKIETRLAQRHPGYKGVFFRRFLRNDTKFMEKELTKTAERRAARLARAGRKSVNRTALRTFGGVFLGVGVYLGITLLSAPEVQGQTIQSESRNNLIKEAITNMEDADKRELAENMMYFTDRNNLAIILDDANNGEGQLLEQMGLYEPTIEASGLTEDEAVDAIIDSAEEEMQVSSEEIETQVINGIQNKPYTVPPLPDMLP